MDDPATKQSTHIKSGNRESNAQMLMKVSLVFQEMKNVGARPDIACYNCLLRAAARAGDINRAQSVLRRLQEDSLEPNDTSWRQLIRAAGNAKRCDVAISTWKSAMNYSHDIKGHLGSDHSQFSSSQWAPSTESFSTLVSTFIRRAADPSLGTSEKRQLYERVISMYERILSGNKDDELGLHRLDANQLLQSPRTMLLILQAVVFLEQLPRKNNSSFSNAVSATIKLRRLAAQILELESLQNITRDQHITRRAFRSLRIAQTWMEDRLEEVSFCP
jgi:pentatricopeptide repeat protein